MRRCHQVFLGILSENGPSPSRAPPESENEICPASDHRAVPTCLASPRSMKTKHMLQLASSTFVAPTDDRWIVRGASDFTFVSFPPLASLPDKFLELLDGTSDAVEIARRTGLDLDDVRAVLRRLRRRHLLASARSFGERSAERWRWEAIEPSDEPVALHARRTVLLVGLGALGLSVLRTFLDLHLGELVICDPSPVGGADVPECFDDDDRGRRRQEAVLHRLPPSLRSQVSAVAVDTTEVHALAASMEAVVGKATAVIACSECASSLASEIGRICRHRRVPFVGAELTPLGAHIGYQRPTVRTSLDDGCWSCETLYRRSRDPFERALGVYAQRLSPNPPPWRYPHDVAALRTLSHLVLLELLAALDAPLAEGVARPRHVFVDFENNSIIARAIPRHYACPVCYPRQVPTIESLRQDARRQWDSQRGDIDPASLRDLWHVLQRFVDPEHGFFQSIQRNTGVERQALAAVFEARGLHAHDAAMVQAHRVMAHRQVVRNGRQTTVTTHGFAFDDPRAAEALAILEGLERLFGLDYCDPSRVVTARYSDVESIALDPRDFPLYADFQYDDPAFKLPRFDPSAAMEWVCGIRVADDEPLLVPRDLIFGPSSPSQSVYLANSSGAACHSSFPRAILNGLYENIERDGLMVAWFNRLSLPRLTMAADDPDPGQLRATLARLSFRLTHVDITNDLGIPLVLAVVEDERDKDFFMVTMAAAQTRAALLEKLYKELFHFCYPLLIHGDEHHTSVSRARDPFSVVTIVDHVCFYQNRRKIRHTSFLTSSADERSFATLPLPGDEPDTPEPQLRHLVERLHQHGYDVVVVDCSAPVVREVGLHVVKVLVPGLQPLHAGHRYRVLGGRRVFEVARLMGYADRDRTVEDLNPWPHPFW